MKTKKWSWAAEKRSMERSFNFITNKKTKIIDIVPPEDALGYTSKDQTIHLAYEHPTMEGLSDTEKIAFRKGVFCHEMLHQIFTDFNALEKALLSLSGPERRVLSLISNILEDPSIEYWAPTVVSGPLLKALRFSIAHIYNGSHDIAEATTPFSQYLSALIQFGDMGLIKGKFTFPEAKKAFAETADVFEKGVTEPIAQKRMDYAKQIFEISRPLWEEEVALEKAMAELADMLSELGKSSMSGTGRGQNGDPSSVSNTRKDKRRKITIKKVSKEEMEELKKQNSTGSGPIPEDADLTIYTCDEDIKEDDSDKSGASTAIDAPASSSNEETGESTSDDKSTSNDEDKGEKMTENNSGSATDATDTEGDLPSDSNASDNCSEQNTNPNESSQKDDDKKSKTAASSKDNPFKPHGISAPCSPSSVEEPESSETEAGDYTIDEGEYQIDEEDIAAILSDLERNENDLEKEKKEETDASPIPDYDISSAKMPEKSCLNYRVTFNESHRESLETAYAQTLNKMATGIHTTTKALKRIFQDDKEEREYRSSGQISLKRLYSGTVTDRIFEKKISPADKSDLVVEILVDESGSMQLNGKYIAARECCIALSEIFKNLNVPVYVIGFTADAVGYDVVHSHYITWKNTKDDRLKLLNISARSDNCDGASIRYATEIIKKKQAKNKLLIVISDGRPAAVNYARGDEDTKDAIRAAKKHTSVLGVAVGNSDTEKIQFFYEKDFLHVSNVDELFGGIAKTVKKIIKSW